MCKRIPGFTVFAVLLLASLPIPLVAKDKYQDEAARLASLMHWANGDVIAEIGAGEGQMSFMRQNEWVKRATCMPPS